MIDNYSNVCSMHLDAHGGWVSRLMRVSESVSERVSD